MKISTTTLAGLALVDTTSFVDHRGDFSRFFCERELAPLIGGRRILQINHSTTSAPGTVRGLHFQRAPDAEMKLVRCIHGRVWDVAVDLRADSPTFLQWHAEELSASNRRMLVIPEGFAHGFQALEPDSQILYLVTAGYSPASESGLRYDDPRLAISWPLAAGEVSERDRAWPLVSSSFPGFQSL